MRRSAAIPMKKSPHVSKSPKVPPKCVSLARARCCVNEPEPFAIIFRCGYSFSSANSPRYVDRFHACRIKTLATPAVVVVEVQQECLALFSGWVDDFAAEVAAAAKG